MQKFAHQVLMIEYWLTSDKQIVQTKYFAYHMFTYTMTCGIAVVAPHYLTCRHMPGVTNTKKNGSALGSFSKKECNLFIQYSVIANDPITKSFLYPWHTNLSKLTQVVPDNLVQIFLSNHLLCLHQKRLLAFSWKLWVSFHWHMSIVVMLVRKWLFEHHRGNLPTYNHLLHSHIRLDDILHRMKMRL